MEDKGNGGVCLHARVFLSQFFLESQANHQIFWYSGFLDADFIASFIKNEQSNFLCRSKISMMLNEGYYTLPTY